MAKLVSIAGMAVGAGLMYVLDPVSGPRRRALVRKRLASARRRLNRATASPSSRALVGTAGAMLLMAAPRRASMAARAMKAIGGLALSRAATEQLADREAVRVGRSAAPEGSEDPRFAETSGRPSCQAPLWAEREASNG